MSEGFRGQEKRFYYWNFSLFCPSIFSNFPRWRNKKHENRNFLRYLEVFKVEKNVFLNKNFNFFVQAYFPIFQSGWTKYMKKGNFYISWGFQRLRKTFWIMNHTRENWYPGGVIFNFAFKTIFQYGGPKIMKIETFYSTWRFPRLRETFSLIKILIFLPQHIFWFSKTSHIERSVPETFSKRSKKSLNKVPERSKKVFKKLCKRF